MSEGNDLRRGVGVGFRLGTELTVSTLVGAVMGYALDWFLGTKPWLMVLGVFFGGAAGCLAAYKAAQATQFSEDDDSRNGKSKQNNETD
ncbi:MAG: AtpZ/AtpI family protein [Nitrospinaceae bacterium]|jgi:ATP synthase protein I|nr:AtpZ/AtpI family protein [Nitrospinaceae bacterium]